MSASKSLRLKLPATSANLGPGFDAVGLALSMHLSVEAQVAPTWQIHATGRDAELCGAVDGNLIVDTMREVLERAGKTVPALRLAIHNEIPLGMGCGSSAAALCAGVALADHFGGLGWSDAEIVAEASAREGHPDNVAPCWYGGFTVAAMDERTGEVKTATFAGDMSWQMLLAMPSESLATKKARALLPDVYAKADAVFNVQRVALLTAAFAQGRLDLLRMGTADRMHQPYRMEACPVLKALLPLAEEEKFASVTLSGAGPSVLMVLAEGATLLEAETRVAALVGDGVELVPLTIAGGAERVVLD